MDGKRVLQRKTAIINTLLDVSSLVAGIYMMRVVNGGKKTITKVIKE